MSDLVKVIIDGNEVEVPREWSLMQACEHAGAEIPRFSPRQADLIWVVGTINHKLAPFLRRIYEQVAEPSAPELVDARDWLASRQ